MRDGVLDRLTEMTQTAYLLLMTAPDIAAALLKKCVKDGALSSLASILHELYECQTGAILWNALPTLQL